MDKNEFLDLLRKRLTGLPEKDIEERVSFYGEMIDEMTEDGMTEREAVEKLGDINEIVSQITSEIPLTRIVKEKIKPKRKMSVLTVILLILGSPIWIPVILVLYGLVLTVFLVILSSVISVVVALVFCIAVGIYLIISAGNPLLTVGLLLILLGLFIWAVIGGIYLVKLVVKLLKMLINGIKSLFIGKEKA